MSNPIDHASPALQAQVRNVLLELGFGAHRIGYKQLCVAIPCFAQDSSQSLIKEIYPQIAKTFRCSDWSAVEHAVRCVIHDAWEERDPDVWNDYFPCSQKPPSNKQFIATMAERLR